MATLRGLLFYVVLAITLVLLSILVIVTKPFMSSIRRYELFCRPWAKLMLQTLRWLCGIRYRVIGWENMPSSDKDVVVLSKHQSAWDPFWLGAYLKRPACFLYKRSLNRVPALGWALWAMDMLPVDRQHGRSSYESFLRQGPVKFRQGFWICLFPEGTRARPGERVRYKTGGARFAKATNTAVLPICINAGHCWPKDSIAKNAGVVTVSIGALIETQDRDPHEITADAEAWIEAELERIESESTRNKKESD